jgi:hypothetical protein
VSSSSRSAASRSTRLRSAAASLRRARPRVGCWRPGSDLLAPGSRRPGCVGLDLGGLDHGGRVAAAGARWTGRDVLTRTGTEEGRASAWENGEGVERSATTTAAYRIRRNRIVSPQCDFPRFHSHRF